MIVNLRESYVCIPELLKEIKEKELTCHVYSPKKPEICIRNIKLKIGERKNSFLIISDTPEFFLEFNVKDVYSITKLLDSEIFDIKLDYNVE